MEQLQVKRVYAPPEAADGRRLLVDALWPRGLSKAHARIDAWLRQIAPSDELRRWFAHDPQRWDEFRLRYGAELDAAPRAVAELRAQLALGPATLLYAARDEGHNNAVALREYLLRIDANG